MVPNLDESPQPTAIPPVLRWICAVLFLAAMAWVCLIDIYPGSIGTSLLSWLKIRWFIANPGYDAIDDQWIVVILIGFILVYQRKALWESIGDVDLRGAIPLLIGAILMIVGYRASQVRLGVAALPIIVWGAAWFFVGYRTAKLLIFPCVLFWLSIPMPLTQQSTVGLQLLATDIAQTGCSLCGIDTYVQGTSIFSSRGEWSAMNIAGGCSGIRSLMSLLMLAITWAYISPLNWWKKGILIASSIPIAVLGNGIRITSIFIMAEVVDPKFAMGTWHDWSGMLCFFPCCMLCLGLVQAALMGSALWKGRRKTIIVTPGTSSSTPTSADHE